MSVDPERAIGRPNPADLPHAVAEWLAADRGQVLDRMRAQLAHDVVLVSPLTDAFTFRGPDEVIAVFESAFEVLSDIEIPEFTGSGNDWVLHGTNTLGGDNLEELQWLHLGADGLIDRITLYIRPAPAAVRLLSMLGPGLNRRGAMSRTGAIASRAAAPIAAVLRLVERQVMPRLHS